MTPEITPIDGRVSPLEFVALRDQFTFVDGDGDTPVRVGFRDHRINAGGGQLRVRGDDLK